jgi:N-succinyl-L-ornithine transcarbamylase
MNHFLSVKDVDDINHLADLALRYKANPFKDKSLGEGKTLGMIFLNPSLRTRISTQVAARNLGMEVIVFNIDKEGWQLEFADGVVMNGDKAEHVKEAAAVIGQYVDILGIRTFPGLVKRQDDYAELVISQFVKYAGKPVLSLESATVHPLQSLADIVTIKELLGSKRKPKIVLTWAPHIKALPQAVPNSFAEWINAWGESEFVITHPENYELAEKFSKGAKIEYNQDKALEGADFIYVKNWSSYTNYGKIVSTDPSWMLTQKKIATTNNGKVMHCLPVRRNLVIADDVLDSSNAIVIQQAGNRLWSAQAVLASLLKNK